MTDKQVTIEAKLHALQQAFGAQLPERLATIQRTWAMVQERADAIVHKDLYRFVHSLAGSAGTFGYQQLGNQARQLEEFLAQLTDVAYHSPESRATINNALAQFETLAVDGPDNVDGALSATPSQTAPYTSHSKTLVYVLEDDQLLAQEVVSQLEQFGYEVEPFLASADITLAQKARPADVLILDIVLPEGDLEGTRIAPQLQALNDTYVPSIFISARDDWEARLAALRAGGSAYFSKPLDFAALVESLDQLLDSDVAVPFRVLIVEDTVLLAQHYATVLQAAGVDTAVINAPEQLLDAMSDFRPELILMDLYMPNCSGIEAAQIIRQHPLYRSLPIVFISTEGELNRQLNALKMGGDDFLQKPITDLHLVAAVTIRAQRFRGLNSQMRCDSLTGLLNHITLKLTLEHELALSQRQKGELSFVMLDIDHFKSINDRYGHPVGDQVIKSLARLLNQRLRKSDTAARYGGEEFALILPDTSLEAARILLDDLRQSFSQIIFTHEGREFSATFSAGITMAPAVSSMKGLIAVADNALYEAKHRGRNQVVLSQIEQ